MGEVKKHKRCALSSSIFLKVFAVLEPRFRLGSGCSVAAFDRLRGTRVVASRRRYIVAELVASSSRKPSTFALDKELIDCMTLPFINWPAQFSVNT